ncbi:MAG: phosphodiester glycosidase family protein, partial [Microcystaceae cyanobacterium]
KAGTLRFTIPRDGYLIVIRKNAVALSAFPIGTTLTLAEQTSPPEMGKFPHIIGAGPLLLQSNRIVLNSQAEKFSKAFQAQKASRSAIAVDRRGNLMIVAVHHRIGGKGASLDEFAQLLQRMGAVDALNLDGGSSTSLALGGQLIDRSPVTAARVHNGIGIFLNK